MTFVYLICFLLVTAGVILLLKLTPEKITDDLMHFVSPKQTLRDKVLTVKGKKKSRKLTVELNRIRDALEQTGKGGMFAVACAASVLLMIVGCVIAIMIDNAFLIPVFAISFALIPFAYAKRTVNYYDKHIKEELDTLKEKSGIDFAYSFSGTDYHSGQKVQLGDVIEVRLTYSVSILGFGDAVFPITVKASASGISQVYWK